MQLINEHKLKALLKEKKWKEISRMLSRYAPPEIADCLSKIPGSSSALIFRALKPELASEVFSYMGTRKQNLLIKSIGSRKTKELLEDLSPDDRTELFEEMPTSVTKKLLRLLNKADLLEAKELLGYPPQSIGREMTPDFISIRPDWSVRRALAHLRKLATKSEIVSILYVLSSADILMGYTTLRELILASPTKKVSELMEPAASLNAFADREEAVKLIKKYDLIALPVVDAHNTMLGIATVDDLIDISEEEATEDFHKIAGISDNGQESESFADVLSAPLSLLYKKRIGWLVLLLGVNVFSGAIISNYEGLISQVVALVFFLPLLTDSGGNAGSQASTLTVRALATGHIKLSDWSSLIKREILVSLALGLTVSVGVAILGIFRGGFKVAEIVSISMAAIILTGSLIGMSLPFILSKLNRDPATASGPLVTSIVDIFGIAIYFSIAKAVLGL